VEYPWAIATLEALRRDESLSSKTHSAALSREEDLLSHLNDLEHRFTAGGMTFELSEYLTGLAYLEAMRFDAAPSFYLPEGFAPHAKK
jgi:hypothetical protein